MVVVQTWPENLSKATQINMRPISKNLRSDRIYSSLPLVNGPQVQFWMADISYPTKGTAEWRQALGLIASLEGIKGKVRIYDPFRQGPLYNISAILSTTTWDDATTWDDGTVWQDGLLPSSIAVDENAALNAKSIVVKGLPASTAAVFNPGDPFEIRPSGVPAIFGHYYMITKISNSNSAGKTRIEFTPGLRAGIAVGDMVVLKKPRCVMRLATDDEGAINVTPPGVGNFGLSFFEALPE